MTLFNLKLFPVKVFSLATNSAEILKHPTSIITLIGVLILIFAFIKIKKVKITTKMTTQIGIALALSAVLQIFRLYHFPQGGSVTLGSMVPILIIALVYGPEVGFLTGFLHGMITLFLDPYILHPIQLLFDYPLPSMALGLAGYFRYKKILGTIVAIFVKFLFHFTSGLVFFGSFAPSGMSPAIYSLVVNGSFMLTDGLICVFLIAILPIKMLSRNIKNGVYR
ncbi:energy-coupled thiamine transporter ThiT [Clostridium sp.]|jgi:thiamine transporter|uniref:energy-coupled thiamine transporter ThiT n=1 Tax=Clostridium sp. TaxID=1506 RepID=UPI00258677C7|nr:energy-coupled thiamine transporter ThiT [Clostridium sp.]MDF2503643.1 yuaJ [Clostridium sp.]